MANITNNNYAGALVPGMSSLIQIGANDMGAFNVGTTNGSKVRFGYATAAAPLQDMSTLGLCGLVSNGVGSLDFMNLELTAIAVRLAECRDAFYETDFAGAYNGVLSQELDMALVQAYTNDLVENFSNGLQALRWSGDSASLVPALAYHDGIIKLVQAAGAFNATTNPEGYQEITTTAVTASNVVAELSKVINALPSEVTSYKGFKVMVGSTVASALKAAAMQPLGVNNLTMTNPDLSTGRLTDNFFGYSIYEARGLNAVAANRNIIIAGIFEDSNKGVLKLGVNTPNDEKSIDIKTLESDQVQFTIGSGQAVALIPDLSQVAMNA